MTNGYSEKIEVETAVAAIGHLASPGDVLHGLAHTAIETFRKLDYSNERVSADNLAGRLIPVMREWNAFMLTLLGD